MTELADHIEDTASGVCYVPWTDGYAVGYEVQYPDGRITYIYLNPSQDSDDGTPNVFVYIGTEGDPAHDAPEHHYDLD